MLKTDKMEKSSAIWKIKGEKMRDYKMGETLKTNKGERKRKIAL